jgi:hypothetical protein
MNTIPLIMDMVSMLSVVSAGLMVVFFLRSVISDKRKTFENNF